MKALIFRGPGRWSVEETPAPRPGPGDVLLKVEACGICGSDLRTLQHGMRFALEQQILGHEIAGTVSEVGRDVRDYRVGDRLAVAADVSCHQCYYCRRALYNLCDDWKLIGTHLPGGMAEYMLLTDEILRHGIVHPISREMSGVHATLAEPAASVLAAQEEAGVSPAEVVVIYGAGPIGCLHVQVAQVRGALPVIVEARPDRLRMAERLDPAAALDPAKDDVAARVRALTGGRGADVAIVACAAKQPQTDSIQIVRKRGRVVLFGGLPRNDPMTPFDSNRIHYEELRVLGAFSYHPRQHAVALDLIARGRIAADRIITAVFPLARAPEAFAAAQRGSELKVVLTP